MTVPPLAKALFAAGAALMLAGGLVVLFAKTPLGRLPGDVLVRRGGATFYFPLATCLFASLLLSLLFSFFGRK